MIACDIDGTIADTAAVVRRRMADALEIDLAITSNMGALYEGVPRHLMSVAYNVLRNSFDTESAYAEAEPFPHAADALMRLASADLLGAYITHRPPHLHQVTLDWLQRRGFPYRPIIHISDKVQGMRDTGCDVIVEDDGEVGRKVAAKGYGVILTPTHHSATPIDYPHVLMTDWLAFQRAMTGSIPFV